MASTLPTLCTPTLPHCYDTIAAAAAACPMLLLLCCVQVAAASLWAMISDAAHPLQPYFASLPKRNELLCPLIQLPEAYLPLLQSDYVVSSWYGFTALL
jgi:hypothetical protein